MESFYWIQMYKLASATRGDKSLMDMHGPWLKDDAPSGSSVDWATGLHLSYAPLYPANRLGLGLSLEKYLEKHMKVFIENIPESFQNFGLAAPSSVSGIDGRALCVNYNEEEEDAGDNPEEGDPTKKQKQSENQCKVVPPAPVGNVLLACYNMWLQYSYSQDMSLVKPLCVLLERAIEYYTRLSQTDLAGFLEFSETYSPGYTEDIGKNANYDIALYKWALRAYVQLQTVLKDNATKHGLTLPEARLRATRVRPFTIEETTNNRKRKGGESDSEYIIAEGVPLTKTSASFSHLYMVYPLSDLTNLSDPKEFACAERSVGKWAAKLAGSPETMAQARPVLSMMSSFLGNKFAAYRNITRYIGRALSPNTFYVDSAGNTRIDGPLAAANALHEMFLLSSDTGEIRVFPCVDSLFIRKAAFWHLRAHNGVLVSSRLGLSGEPDFVELVNPGNATLDVTVVHGFRKGFKTYPPNTNRKDISKKVVQLKVPGEKSVLLVSVNKFGGINIAPIPGRHWDQNPWGVHK